MLETLAPPVLDAKRQLSIQATLASAETFTEGFTEDTFKSWQRALEMASSLGDVSQQLTCVVVMWAHRIRAPDFPAARRLAEIATALAQAADDRGARAMAQWMLGITQHHQGDLAAARGSLQRSLEEDTPQSRRAMLLQFGYDRRIPSMGALSNLSWLEGHATAARSLAAKAVTEARTSPYPVPLSEALTWQALTLHLSGDDPGEIDRLLDETAAHAGPHFIDSYVGLALALKGLNAARTRGVDTAMVAQGLHLLSASHYEVFHPLFQTECARLQVDAGEHLSPSMIDPLLRLSEAPDETWETAEVRRNVSAVLRRHGAEDRADQLLDAAGDCAERQGALAWGLRVAMDAHTVAADEPTRHQRRDRLAGLLAQFSDGEETLDVEAARHRLAGTG